jgi:hypothetical protein
VALKFIRLDTRDAGLEERSLEVIRNIRHVHLLGVQFATRIADILVIATPLCDQPLLDRLHAFQAEGRPGIPAGSYDLGGRSLAPRVGPAGGCDVCILSISL